MSQNTVRIDKWLWAARFFKTRGLATEIVNAGHVQLNGMCIKASKKLQIGDVLNILCHEHRYIIHVIGLAEKRASASIAQGLYIETEASLKARDEQRQCRKFHHSIGPAKRPNKKARRQIIRFRRQED